MQARPQDAQESRMPAGRGTRAAAPRRRCLVTRASHPKGGLLRFVVAPDGVLVPDLGGKLPGRGLYVAPDRALLQTAIDKRLFDKAARRPVEVPADMPDTVGLLLRRRALDLVGFANRAGQAVAGFDRAKMWLEQGRCALVIQARDGAAGGRERLAGLMLALQETLAEAGPEAAPAGVPAGGPKLVELFDQDELGAAFARPSVVHVAVAPGGLARQLASTADQIVSYEEAASAKRAARERKAR